MLKEQGGAVRAVRGTGCSRGWAALRCLGVAGGREGDVSLDDLDFSVDLWLTGEKFTSYSGSCV